ncbi:GntR family transcriptional regulator [Salmonella enterica]|nr:GntR family transcriptional regulator [Salmonella enterica]EGM4656853.1 GntR family transcriptional regulator [Salmonella enterica]
MAYSKIRQPKLSDVIEQQLEFLILEGTLRPGEKLPPERELAKQFDVSRPSLREAIQRLEAKGLLLRRQGGGTFVQSSLWQSFSDPLVELLSDHPESQFDLLETRHALEGIAAYYAALRSTDEDKDRIRELHHAIELAQESGDLDAESEAVLQYQIAVTEAVLQYQIAVTEAAHNVVLLHLLRCMEPMLAQNVRQNFELLYARREMLPLVSTHRTRIFEAIMAGKPEEAREASHRHLAFIEEIMLDRSREESRRERALRRLEQRKN